MLDTQRFPSLTLTGYRGTGWTSRQANGFYQSGANGTLSKLAGTHSFKAGGDYRQIGVKGLNYGASTGTYTFTGTFSGNALADLLLGYPQSGNVPLSKQVDGYVNYYSALRAGRLAGGRSLDGELRSAPRTRDGARGAQQSDHSQFRSERREPAQQRGQVRRSDHQSTTHSHGRFDFRWGQRRTEGAGSPAGDQPRAACRHRVQLQRQDRAARRLRTVLGAVELSGGWHDQLGTDRLLVDDEHSATNRRAEHHD